MAKKQVFAGHGSGMERKRFLLWYWMLLGIGAPAVLILLLPRNIVGALIFGICAAVGLFVYYIYRKDSSRELGDRTAELDDAGLTLFFEKDKSWTVGWDDIAEVGFRRGDYYRYGRDIELVITDRRKKELVLSEFDDLREDQLRELFGALKARLEGMEVRFGTIEEMERQESR